MVATGMEDGCLCEGRSLPIYWRGGRLESPPVSIQGLGVFACGGGNSQLPYRLWRGLWTASWQIEKWSAPIQKPGSLARRSRVPFPSAPCPPNRPLSEKSQLDSWIFPRAGEIFSVGAVNPGLCVSLMILELQHVSISYTELISNKDYNY